MCNEAEETNVSSQPHSLKKPKVPIQRQDNACTECRKHKIRCSPGDDSRWPCRRCVRQNLYCEVLQHHRGRKRKNPLPPEQQQPQKKQANDVEDSQKPAQTEAAVPLGSFTPAASNGSAELVRSKIPESQQSMELDSIFQPPEAGPSNTGNVQSASNTAPQDSTNNPFSPAASMQFPLQVQPPQPPTPSAASSDQSFTGTNASSSTHHPYNSSKVSGTSLLAMRFPFLDGNAADPSQHAGQRVSMFSLRSLLQDHDTSKDPNMPSLATTSAYLGSGGLHHSHEDEAEVYTADPVSTGLMDLSTAHAHFQRFVNEINPLVFVFDTDEHTHDRVRASSAFLYTTVIAVSTKYGTTTDAEREINQNCWSLVRNHIKMSAFRDERSIERVMALLVLGCFGEADEKSTSSIFPIAVSTARLLGLGQLTPHGASESEAKVYRIWQRIWLALFVCNSIAFLQHNLYQSVSWTDPLVTHCTHWHEDSTPSMHVLDTLLVASVQNRRAMFHYQELLAQLVGPHNNSLNSTALSILTRSALREMDSTNVLWREELDKVAAPEWMHHKSIIWHNASKLKLNLSIVTHGLRATETSFTPPDTAPARKTPDVGGLYCFHVAINSARAVLETFLSTSAKAVVFSSDAFLHLLLYASFFLWSISADPNGAFVGPTEAEDCTRLISKTASHMQSCSFDAQDSCGLHARFLRLLLQTPAMQQSRPGSSRGDASRGQPTNKHFPSKDSNADSLARLPSSMALPRTETAFDPAPQLGAMATNPSTNMIDLNALFNGRLTDEFSWAFPSGWEFGMSDEAASGTTPALHPAN